MSFSRSGSTDGLSGTVTRAFAYAFIATASCGVSTAVAQDTLLQREPEAAPRMELVRSLGQPPLWRPFATGGVAFRGGNDRTSPVAASLGIERALKNPVGGSLSVSGEGYLQRTGERLTGGARALVLSPIFYSHAGADWSERLGRVDFVVGTTVPLRRGGWPLPGSQLRAHWLPGRNNSAELSLLLPLAQPFAGRTRPRATGARLPTGSLPRTTAAALSSNDARMAWRSARGSMTQLVSLLTFFWLIEERNISYAASVLEWREALADFSAEFFPPGTRRGTRSQYQREADAYHASLERAYSFAVRPTTPDPEIGRMIADTGRRIALVEVVLPYNRTYGRFREPNSLEGLSAAAHRRFESWLATRPELEAVDRAQALVLFDLWLAELETLRARISGIARDPRLNWMPLGLVLRPEEHRTQSQIDELIELATERRFTDGNTAFTIDAPQFQVELKRSIRETRSAHVLWVHDYRGIDEMGDPDRTSFDITLSYLRGLRDAVRRYDATGVFPTYMVLVDQHFWEVTRGRLWMNLLERPLTHRVSLKPGFGYMESAIAAMQDSLRTAVAASQRLQREARSNGRDWIPGLVKVHVNVSNPVDFSFRTRRIMPPLGSDNLLRDHRKMILRDPDESDPTSGEVVFAGVGVGDHYASATWEDRAMIVRGPAVASTLPYLRATLERHALGGDRMPAVFRAREPAPGAAVGSARNSVTRGDATARVLQTHNEVGWGPKESSYVQMLLYDLAPEGSLIFVPDALWSSYQWMAQLVGAALRGCRVYIVAPAKANAPAAGFPWMSVQQELVTRLTLVEEALGDVIRAGGGDLRVGLYARTAPLDDYAASLEAVGAAWRRHAFLRQAVPLSDNALATLSRAAGEVRRSTASTAIVPDVRDRRPMLHRKTQWIMSAEALAGVAAAEQLPAALEASLAVPRFGAGAALPERVENELRLAAVRALLDIHSGLGPRAASAPLYFTTGSINKNPRSMMIDGEVLGLVAGPWSYEPFLDFLVLVGTTTWVESLADVEEHLPPYSRQQRRLGRWLYPII